MLLVIRLKGLGQKGLGQKGLGAKGIKRQKGLRAKGITSQRDYERFAPLGESETPPCSGADQLWGFITLCEVAFGIAS